MSESSGKSNPRHDDAEGPRGVLRRRPDGSGAPAWAIALVVVVLLLPAAYGLTKSPLFAARHIAVTGQTHLDRADVIRLAGVAGTNVFWFQGDAVERRLEKNRWIADATVSRSLPSSIHITIRERFPVAQAEADGRYLLLATDGSILGRAEKPRPLPMVRFDPAVGAAMKTLRGPARVVGMMDGWLRSRVAAVSETSEGDVMVRLESGVTANYGPPSGLAAKGDAVAAVLQWAADNEQPLASIDVRVPLAPTARLFLPEPDPVPVEVPAEGDGTKSDAAAQKGHTNPSPSPSPAASQSSEPKADAPRRADAKRTTEKRHTRRSN